MPNLQPTIETPDLLDGGGDHRFRQMLYDLLHLEAFMRRARERLGASAGVSSSAYAILMKVAEADREDGVRVSDVAEKLHVTGAFVTREANQLVKSGLLAKDPDPDDGRSVRLVLTAEAIRRLRVIAPMQRSINDQLFGHMNRQEFETFSRLTARISSQADNLSSDELSKITKLVAAE